MITTNDIDSMVIPNAEPRSNAELYGFDVYKLIGFEDDMAVIVNRNSFKLLVFPENFSVTTTMFDQVPEEYQSKLIDKHLYKAKAKVRVIKETKESLPKSTKKITKSCNDCVDYTYCVTNNIIKDDASVICSDYKPYKVKINKNQMFSNI